MPNSIIIQGATLIDGVAPRPLEGKSVWIEGQRVRAIGQPDELGKPPGVELIDGRGKYVIPGLMNANIHLFGATTFERLARHVDQYEAIIAESAQVALKSGLTTVFDTWGPRRFLMNVRERIEAGSLTGSRLFCAGNIIGFDGPFSADFPSKESLSMGGTALAKRTNAIFVENVGRHLMWLTPDQVGREVRSYIGRGIGFLKYASNEHLGAFLSFSTPAQAAIVAEAHRAGLTAQAHCCTVEGLRMALEAGCDLITHANFSGPTPIPQETLQLFVDKNIGAVVFPFTQRRLDWYFDATAKGGFGDDLAHTKYRAADANVRSLIRAGATLLLGNDACVLPPELTNDPAIGPWLGRDIDNYLDLSQGHFYWFKAMEEKGLAPMEMLRAATRNIAAAYGMDEDLGTLEAGKIADLIMLEKNPLEAAENYRTIHAIMKNGLFVDREVLPLQPVLTRPLYSVAEEEANFIPYLRAGRYPFCPMCIEH